MAVWDILYKPEFCAIAAKVLADGESIAAVCAELDIGRSTFYEWKEAYPEFAHAVEKGLQKAQREWERLATKGIKGEIDKFSASTLIFTMKNRFRNDYADDKKEEDKGSSASILEKILAGDIIVKHD